MGKEIKQVRDEVLENLLDDFIEEMSQEELVMLINKIKAELDERNNGIGDSYNVTFKTHI